MKKQLFVATVAVILTSAAALRADILEQVLVKVNGEVTGGFSREEILRPEKEDPRAEGGVFNRVSGLLRDLSEGVSIG